MQATNAAMSGGHCFGFAATAADLFNNLLTPGQFQPGALQTYDLRLRDPISKEIARNMASQYTFDVMKYKMSPRAVVSTLRTALTPGSMPFTLFIFWGGGGHAITPYALYDKGNGQYDVAVYDNNYPDAARALRIDTTKNKYEYLVMTTPDGEPEIADQIIGLIPSDVIAATQSCPFCVASNNTTVQLSPVRSQVPIKTRITDLDGKKIKGVVVNPPTNPWRPGREVGVPHLHGASQAGLHRHGEQPSQRRLGEDEPAGNDRSVHDRHPRSDRAAPRCGRAGLGPGTGCRGVRRQRQSAPAGGAGLRR